MATTALKTAGYEKRRRSGRAWVAALMIAIAGALGLIFRVFGRVYGDPYLAGITTVLIVVTVVSLLSPRSDPRAFGHRSLGRGERR